MKKSASALAIALAALSLASPAHALSNRVWVSGHGADAASCGAATSPCRTFQYALDNIVVAGGEIDVLDPAGYGILNITKAVSIVNDGAGVAGIEAPLSGQDAILINAGASDSVVLRGLTIDGLGAGLVGIQIAGAGSVTIAHCEVRHFEGLAGILAQPAGGSMILVISDVVASDNAHGGISVGASFTGNFSGLIRRTIASGNGTSGFALSGVNGSGQINMLIDDSAATGNGAAGFEADSTSGVANTTLLLDNIKANDNSGSGVAATGAALVRMTRSAITNNAVGVAISAAPAAVQSYGDNAINGNTLDVQGALGPTGLR